MYISTQGYSLYYYKINEIKYMNIKGSVLNCKYHILAAFCLVKCIHSQVSEI